MSNSHRDATAAAAWAASGLAALTGRRDGPAPGAPRAVVEGVSAWATQLAERTAALDRPVRVDPLALLAERAALTGLTRGGGVSCGGGSRLLAAADDWVAVSLTRADDWDLVAAWLGRSGPVAEGDWDVVAACVADMPGDRLRSGAELLGLPVAVLGERDARTEESAGPVRHGDVSGIHGIRAQRIRPAAALTSCAELVVLDLSSLWAGPLAGRLLLAAGARVVKVESTRRPDGAREGPVQFFSRLNAGKASVALDLTSAIGRRQLGVLVAASDVVITAARPRALEQLGLDPVTVVAEGRTRLWLSITGYGARAGQRVAFGDDAAVAGGLTASDEQGPCFCADAVADPLSGLAGATAAVTALGDGGGWVLDVSMADVAGGLAGPDVPLAGLPVGSPSASADEPLEARALGADTVDVLTSLAMA